MKTKKLICSAAVFFLIVFFSASFSAAATKVGILNIQKVMTESKAGAAAFSKLKDESQKMKEALDKKISEFKRLQQESMITSGDKHKEILKNLKNMKADIEGDQQKYARQMRALEIQTLKPVRDRIFELVKEEGEKGGFTLILEGREAGVMYLKDSIDINEKIIKRYNAEYTKK